MITNEVNLEGFYKRLNEHQFGDIQIFVMDEVVVNQDHVDWHHIIIKDVVFKEKLIIRDCEINSGIRFVNCKFEKGVIFHNVKSTNFNSTYNPNNESVCFEKIEASLVVFESNCFLDRSLTFKNDCKIEKLDISKFENRNAGIIVKKSNFEYQILRNIKTEINISNSIFQKSIRFESIIGDVSFIRNEFHEDIMIWNLECPNRFTLNYNNFKDNFEIEASRIKALTIYGDVFEKKAVFENRNTSPNGLNINTYLNKIYISQAKFNEGIDFNGLGKNIEELDLIITPELKGVLNFDNWIVDKTTISGINQNSKLLFKNLKFRFLYINDFTNFNDVSFDRCKGNGNEAILNLINSDLGSTRFNEFDLKSFKLLRLNNVAIDKIRPSNINWFEDSQVEIEVHEQRESEKSRRKREIYRQLKQALKSQGNQIDSLIFQARELSTYKTELEMSKKYSLGDKIIMWVSETNDFGLNWFKPVYIVFSVTFLLYLIILPSVSKEIGYGFAKNITDLKYTWVEFSSNGKILWQLFNPVRKINEVFSENSKGWVYLIDLLHRIFLGVMIFQIIKAFRKYVSN